VPKQAREMTRSQARVNILVRHLRNVIYATPKEIARVFGWGAKDSQAAINTLAEQGTISMGEMKGVNGEVVFLK
jgi:hypothetical protein